MILLNFGNFSKCWKSRFSQSLLFHSIPLPYVVNQIFPLYFVMGSFPPATAPNFQNFSKSYVLHLLTVANFFFSKIFLSPPMLSIRCRWLLMGVFFDIFLSPLCSPFVAGGYCSTTQNFSKCRKSCFSQSLLFHSIPFSYVVNRIFPCTLLWEVFGQPLHNIFKIFLSPMYSIRCRWL